MPEATRKPQQILITGASRGIGYETALTLAQAGHVVFATARNREKLEKLKEHHPDQIHIIPADLSLADDAARLTAEIGKKSRKIDLAIHNAGGLINKSFETLSDSDWQTLIDVNLLSAVRLFRNILPLTPEGAHFVTIGSMGGFQGSAKFPGLSAYSTTKGALAILTECLAVEFSTRNISVNCLCLGAVQTEMLDEAFPGLKAPVTASEMAVYIADFGLKAHQFYNGRILPVALGDPG